MSDLSKDDIIAAASALSAANLCPVSGSFALPCHDHRPSHTLDAETQWVIIRCETCKMSIHLHPQTYVDLMIAIEIDEIGEEMQGRK